MKLHFLQEFIGELQFLVLVSPCPLLLPHFEKSSYKPATLPHPSHNTDQSVDFEIAHKTSSILIPGAVSPWQIKDIYIDRNFCVG